MDVAKSLFYQVNYLPPVRMDEQQLEQWKTDDPTITGFIQEEFQDGVPKDSFTAPLTLNPSKYGPYAQEFQKKGWRVLSEKPVMEFGKMRLKPYYSVLEHDRQKGWIVKHAGKRKPDGYPAGGAPQPLSGDYLELDQYCSLLRIAMADRIRKLCLENPDELDGVTVPEKHLVEIQPGALKDASIPLDQKFVIVARKVDCLSMEETVNAIDGMTQDQQERLANKLVTLVTKAGLADASFSNIRLGKEGDVTEKGNRRIYIVDTEPSNAMVLDRGWWNNLFTFQSSLEQAGRLGTVALRMLAIQNWATDKRAPHFVARIKEHIEAQKSNKYSPTKVSVYVLSVLALTMIYHKKVVGPKIKPYFEKYADTTLYKKVSGLEVGRKTYYAAVLSPLGIGFTREFAYGVCVVLNQTYMQNVDQKHGMFGNPEQKMEEHLQNPWLLRAARIQGQARFQMSEKDLLRAQGIVV